MPTSRAGLGVAAVNGRIYAIGGWNPCPINTTEEYNPATDTWSTKSAMPTARMFFGTAVYQDRIYVKGGKVGQKATNVTEVYDPSTDKWTIGTPIPNAVYGYASAVVGSKIYVISGSTLSPNSSITSLNQVYDVDSDSWTLGARVPTAVNAPAGISITDGSPKIFVIGGGGSEFHATYNLTQIYDVQSNSWSAGAPIPAYRFTLGAAFLDKTLYAIGGADNLAAKNEVYSINLGAISPEFPIVALVVTCLITVIVAVVVLLKVATAKSSNSTDVLI
jgi:N-acetylneuraminic acid mutarotase